MRATCIQAENHWYQPRREEIAIAFQHVPTCSKNLIHTFTKSQCQWNFSLKK